MRIIALFLIAFLLTPPALFAQRSNVVTPRGIVPTGTTYSKGISLYLTKQFVMEELLGASEQPVVFEVDALSAADSGELTSLVYKCAAKQKEGMVLAFWGNQFNPAGVVYQAYGFKSFPKDKANEYTQVAFSSYPSSLSSSRLIYVQCDC